MLVTLYDITKGRFLELLEQAKLVKDSSGLFPYFESSLTG